MTTPPATPFAVVFDWGEEFGSYQSADNQAIAVGETERASARCLRSIADGACALDNPHNVPLPIVPDDPKARYTPTKEFVEAMVETFKNGGKMPKRVVWEIILGVKSVVDAEASLVEIEVPKGVTCDIVGDSEYKAESPRGSRVRVPREGARCSGAQAAPNMTLTFAAAGEMSQLTYQRTASSTTSTTSSASSSRQATTTWSSSTVTLWTAARGLSRSS